MSNGKFVISLDFESHWGFFDNRTLTDSRTQLLNISTVINRLLKITKDYDVSMTFATVGMMFAKDKSNANEYKPDVKPKYNNTNLDAYKLLHGISETDQKFYFTRNLIEKIENDPLHEMGTHTFSHYYCYEKGQTIEDFKIDLTTAVAIAKDLNIETKSIVFPRNQVQDSYLGVCEDLGIETYRGYCWFNFNKEAKNLFLKELGLAALRVLDTYINFTGSNSFKLEDYNNKNDKLINIPSSRFLRPYNSRLKFMESLKVKRIKNGMTKAAKQNEVYHLWWHPHNFANDTEENFKNFLEIIKHYDELNKTYNFESITMQKLGKEYRKS